MTWMIALTVSVAAFLAPALWNGFPQAFLGKPFTLSELTNALNQALGR
ncbi:MAG: hypothetical protein KJ630_20190 [Proteobacteria bacterium]|nr:hypothetical protein [Pseudomonadota bacterium]